MAFVPPNEQLAAAATPPVRLQRVAAPPAAAAHTSLQLHQFPLQSASRDASALAADSAALCRIQPTPPFYFLAIDGNGGACTDVQLHRAVRSGVDAPRPSCLRCALSRVNQTST
jgi:hypothetical protein